MHTVVGMEMAEQPHCIGSGGVLRNHLGEWILGQRDCVLAVWIRSLRDG